ncbi:response regulator transcription factor [uncultured Thermomonospora sp.]|mgnify:CR=1 FL=1|uniref:Two component transcriptional regulator, LuxR family n=2 Tax=Thermomonosporaceae TaxID=2012 RepID=D1ABX5_THECD|nr:response regulator transcription factor [uncultured Thermomonospora sp.]ACY99148.1 two component transcriptional regulator, LuxR family [Thermomonospora curvata DSM 43183]
MIRVLVMEELSLLRGGIVALLDGQTDFMVVGAVDNAEQLVPMARKAAPDIALLGMEGAHSHTFALTGMLRQEVPDCAAVLMADRARPGDLRRAAAVGAAGFLLKGTSPDTLAGSLRRVAAGERVIDADLAFAELAAADSPLTPRELEVLRLAGEGASVAQIADTLVLTIGTVRNHLSRINRKIGARNRVHAIRIAESAGWL